MGLVDGDETDVHVTEFRLEQFGRETLGRDVKDTHMSEDAVLEGDDDLLAGETRIDGCCTDTPSQEMVHLIFHQGDEWGDDDTRTLLCEGRHLERDGLASTRGHQSQRVVSTADRLDDLALNTTEIIVAPILSEYLPVIINCQLSIIN